MTRGASNARAADDRRQITDASAIVRVPPVARMRRHRDRAPGSVSGRKRARSGSDRFGDAKIERWVDAS
jgi:hypothetical protein